MKKNRFLPIIVAMSAAFGFGSCSSVELPEAPYSAGVESLTSQVNGRQVTLSWTLPESSDIVGVQILRNGELVATLDGPATSYVVKRATPGMNVAYTVKVIYANDRVSEGSTTRFDIISNEKIVMLLACDRNELTDDDEIAAADWLEEAYGSDCEFMNIADATSIDPAAYPVVWIHIDRIGLASGWRNLPGALVSDKALEVMNNYIAAGGNVLLTKFATQLTVPYGYLAAEYAPNIFGSGEGGRGDDIWTINANIGLKYDHRNDVFFKGLTTSDQYNHQTFPLEGPGWREDHNCCWDLNAYRYTAEGDNTVEMFQNQNHCDIVATWGHVVDYAVAGMLSFPSTDTRAGRCVAIGLAAYEFNQEGGNEYQANINRLTRNCIDYLNE
ncbi:MAG: DUF4960 domain-containing protein [Muribaculaceae bacterium]|nr:DUF4960 domain-containing protein [Muribaculaceae bacterium]